MRLEGEAGGGCERGASTSLDQSTQLGRAPESIDYGSGWRFTSWHECFEASLVWVCGPRGVDEGVEYLDHAIGVRRVVVDEKVRWITEDGEVLDEEPDEAAARRWRQSNGRASSTSRRYFVCNRLRYMWVLTFAEATRERREVMRLVSEFARRLRASRAGKAIPYWYSPELHPGGHGWHVNFFVAEWMAHAEVAALWGHGYVWATDFAKARRAPKGEPLGLCLTPREGWRRAARYGCKYSQKDWSPEHVGPANHRYEVAQHFAPKKVRHWVRDKADAEQLIGLLVPEDARKHLSVWDSNDEREWPGPPIRTWRW
jgi:hypothetical protein